MRGSYRSGVVVVVSVLRVGRLGARFALKMFDLCRVCVCAGGGALLEEVGHISDSEHGDEGSLQQPHQNVTPVMFEVRHARVSDVEREQQQEELDCGSNEACPLPLHPGLDVERQEEHAVHPEGRVAGVERQPGLSHIVMVAGAVDLQHVAVTADRGAHRQEVRTRATYNELGHVGQ